MHTQLKSRRVSGHVKLVERRRGPVWYARIRTADARQVQRVLGPAWRKNGRPPDGYFTETTANQALALMLAEQENKPANVVHAGVTFSAAAEEWLRYTEHDRECRPATLRDYRGTVERLRAAFGNRRLEDVTPQDVEAYKGQLLAQGRLSARTINRHLVILGGIFRRAERKWGLRHNPAADAAQDQLGHAPARGPEAQQATYGG